MPTSAAKNDFATNTGAIIGVSIGGVVALIVGAFVIFLVCGRFRRRRAIAATNAAPSTSEAEPKGGIASRLARGVSGSSRLSARPILNRDLSDNSLPWRSPLSDEDGPIEEDGENVEYPSRQRVGPPVTFVKYAKGSSSGHGHGSSSNGHESAETSGSVHHSPMQPPSMSQVHIMPGFTQAAETMRMGSGSPPSPTAPPRSPSSHGHSSSSTHQGHLSRSATASSLQPNAHSSLAYAGTGASTSGAASGSGSGSGSSNSHSNSGGHGNTGVVVPKVKINGQSRSPSRASSSNKRGFIERLRGGRGSTQGTSGVETPASSSYYPPTAYPIRSSLLNPPIPPAAHSPADTLKPPLLQPPMPMPSPALTDDSRADYVDGLLNPLHSIRRDAGLDPIGTGGNVSEVSLRDHVDYSRPFGGFVFNRMDSSTTVATADTRTTQTARTPTPYTPTINVPAEHARGSEDEPVDDSVDERNRIRERDREQSYFSPR